MTILPNTNPQIPIPHTLGLPQIWTLNLALVRRLVRPHHTRTQARSCTAIPMSPRHPKPNILNSKPSCSLRARESIIARSSNASCGKLSRPRVVRLRGRALELILRGCPWDEHAFFENCVFSSYGYAREQIMQQYVDDAHSLNLCLHRPHSIVNPFCFVLLNVKARVICGMSSKACVAK